MTIEKPRHPVNCYNSVPVSDHVADTESSSSDSLDGLKTLDSFLAVLHQTVDKAISNFKNIVIIDDMNINTSENSSSLNKLSEFCDTLDLHNLMKVSTCEMQHTSSLIDLTNRKKLF